MSHLLSLTNVSVCLHKAPILQNINLEIRSGRIYGVLGPNGAGKTTLLKAVMNAVPYTGFIENHSPTPTIGSLIEYPAFYSRLSVRDNLQLFADYRGITQDIELILEEVGLGHVADLQFGRMSMGMRQRLAIGRALSGEPALLLLDEPTNGLDPAGIHDVRQLLVEKRNSADVTSIISSHNLPELAAIADVLLIIRHGELLCEVPTTGDGGFEVDSTANGKPSVRKSPTGRLANLEELYLELLGGSK